MIYRKSKGAVADTTLVHNTKVEIIWTVVPVIILIAMAVPAAQHAGRRSRTRRNTELTIKVTGYQWGWHYDYLDKGVDVLLALDRKSDAARQLGSGIDPNTVEQLPAQRRQPAGGAGRHKVRLLVTGATSSTPGGCRPSA